MAQTKRSTGQNTERHSELAAYTVDEFCRAHGGIARSHFYDLVREGRGPRLMKGLGRRTLISQEAAAEWRRRMEGDSPSAASAA